MTKFIKGDRIWVLAQVATDQHAEEFVSAHVLLASGSVDTSTLVYADAKKARMETPRVEPGMWVSIGMRPYEVIHRSGDYLWCRSQGGNYDTVHISSVSSRREGPRSTEPVDEPGKEPPEPPPAPDAVYAADPADIMNDNSKADWWPMVDKYEDGFQMSREEFSKTFPEAGYVASGSGWTMVTPKGYWRLPAGPGTVWTYRDDIPF